LGRQGECFWRKLGYFIGSVGAYANFLITLSVVDVLSMPYGNDQKCKDLVVFKATNSPVVSDSIPLQASTVANLGLAELSGPPHSPENQE
jgi:hypothetical protein